MSHKKVIILVISLFVISIFFILIYTGIIPLFRKNVWIYENNIPVKYIKENGKYCQSEWIEINGNWYYFDENSLVVRNKHTISGVEYIFSETGVLLPGWINENNEKHYINSDKTIATGWLTLGSDKYYLDKDGNISTGKCDIDNETYFFDNDGKLQTGWISKGSTYYAEKDGKLVKTSKSIDGIRYQFDKDGLLKTGWIREAGKARYIRSDRSFETGLTYINGKYYLFDNEGYLTDKSDLISTIDSIPISDTLNSSSKDSSQRDIEGFGGFTLKPSDKIRINNVLEKITSRYNYNIGFIVFEINSSSGIYYSPDTDVYSASCIKGPYIASLVKSNPEYLDTIGNSLEQIICYSDNKLYSSFRRIYGREHFKDYVSDLNIKEDVTTYNYPHITPRNLTKLWIENYYFFNTDETGKKLSKLYEEPNVSTIHAALSEKYLTQSKAGWSPESKYFSTNDGGIIYPKNGSPYIIAICSNMPADMDALNELCTVLDDIIPSQ